MNGDALVRGGGAHGIDGVRLRRQQAKTPKTEGRLANAPLRILRIVVLVPHGKHDFPDPRGAVTWILGEQFVEISRAASGDADDEDRAFDGVAGIALAGSARGARS